MGEGIVLARSASPNYDSTFKRIYIRLPTARTFLRDFTIHGRIRVPLLREKSAARAGFFPPRLFTINFRRYIPRAKYTFKLSPCVTRRRPARPRRLARAMFDYGLTSWRRGRDDAVGILEGRKEGGTEEEEEEEGSQTDGKRGEKEQGRNEKDVEEQRCS